MTHNHTTAIGHRHAQQRRSSSPVPKPGRVNNNNKKNGTAGSSAAVHGRARLSSGEVLVERLEHWLADALPAVHVPEEAAEEHAEEEPDAEADGEADLHRLAPPGLVCGWVGGGREVVSSVRRR